VQEIVPVPLANVPERQSEQLADPAILAYDPAAQDEQLEVPFEVANLPVMQAIQSAEIDEPSVFKEVPTGHALHDTVPPMVE